MATTARKMGHIDSKSASVARRMSMMGGILSPGGRMEGMERTPYFAETAVGAVTLVAFQFLSLPVLIGGVAPLGIGYLPRQARRATTRQSRRQIRPSPPPPR